MLTKKKRLTKELFQDVMKTGGTISSTLFVFRYLKPITGMGMNTRYAFVAPKSVAKHAIDRNKLRRQGYNNLRYINDLPQLNGIFFYKKGAKLASTNDIKENIEFILKKVR